MWSTASAVREEVRQSVVGKTFSLCSDTRRHPHLYVYLRKTLFLCECVVQTESSCIEECNKKTEENGFFSVTVAEDKAMELTVEKVDFLQWLSHCKVS